MRIKSQLFLAHWPQKLIHFNHPVSTCNTKQPEQQDTTYKNALIIIASNIYLYFYIRLPQRQTGPEVWLQCNGFEGLSDSQCSSPPGFITVFQRASSPLDNIVYVFLISSNSQEIRDTFLIQGSRMYDDSV